MRFPEFQGEWKWHKLGEIANIIGGGTPNTTIEEYWNGEIQWFTPSEIKSPFVEKSERTITELGLIKSSAKLLPVGAILVTTRATIGEVAIAQKECCTNQGFQSLVVDDGMNNIFIANWIKQNKNELTQRAKGSTFAEINKSAIEKIPIAIPETDEQNKIAKFLTLLDERISTQNKIIEQYKSLIKGIIDITFVNADRKEYKIADLGEPFRVMSLSKEDVSIDGNECILYGELFTTYGPIIHDIKSRTKKIAPKLTVSTPQDLLFPSSTTVDARSLISPSAITKAGVILGGDMFGIRVDERFNNRYLSFLFNTIYKNLLAKYAKGSTIFHLHYSEIKSVKIELPELQIQNKTVKILSLLETKLEIENALQLMFQNQKEYLLRELFI